MRTFIAIELPLNIKEALKNLQAQLKQSGADVKWVEPSHIHLTLKFLGEINEKQLEEIKQIIEEICRNYHSYTISLSSVGAFPKITYPKVIWIGTGKGNQETKNIAEALDKKISLIGIKAEERPFSSHITLGRLKSNFNSKNLTEILTGLENKTWQENLEFAVDKITLFKSTLDRSGPTYEIINQAHLKS